MRRDSGIKVKTEKERAGKEGESLPGMCVNKEGIVALCLSSTLSGVGLLS